MHPAANAAALSARAPEMRLREKVQKYLHEVGLEDVAQRHPSEVHVQRRQRGANELRLLGVGEHEEAQVMDEAELIIQLLLQLADLDLREQRVRF